MKENELKVKVSELRKEGYGYKKIAKELSMTVSAIRYICIKMEDDSSLFSTCKNCNSKIKSTKGKKKKVFCSDNCRWQWWNKNPKKIDKKAYYTHQCKQCKKEFTAYGNNKRIYCSQKCYIEHKRLKGNVENETK
jgi:hypothetical protein